MTDPLRFGVIGAARIAPKALIEPASKIHSVTVTRVAARERSRAEAFAAAHGIAAVSDDYTGVIEADDVDVVYNPLSMNLHAEWTIAALRAGKHVLCEKSLASNAVEAAEMVRVADEEERILGEAFHHRYHPMFERIVELCHSRVIGTVERVEAVFNISIPQPNIRWDYETAGGSLMDLGCYPVTWVRHVVGEEPSVLSAEADVGPERVDAAISAELAFPGGATARIESSMISDTDDIRLVIDGSRGSIEAINPLAPQEGNMLTVQTDEGVTAGPVDAGVTYDHMLRAFVDHVEHGTPYLTKGQDSIANMTAIDSIYVAAGLSPRGT
ncbi:MAG: Gfo/Idh/MocA family protein [Acidimicrobiales bacterium]